MFKVYLSIFCASKVWYDVFVKEPKPDVNAEESALKFVCPNCGNIARDDVIFLCNHCKQEDLIYKEGVYMCPACLAPGENFQCMLCDSKEVKLFNKDRSPHKTS